MARKKAPRSGRPATRTVKRGARTAKTSSQRSKPAPTTTPDRKLKDRQDATPQQRTPPTMLPPEPPKEIAEALAFPASARTIDHFFSAVLGRMTLGVSPAGFMTAYFEWLSHLFASPGKQIELMQKAARKASRFVVQVAARRRRSRNATLYRTFAPGPSLQCGGVAAGTVQLDLSVVPAEPAVVVQRDDRGAGRDAAERRGYRIHYPTVARYSLAVQLYTD